MYAVDNAGGLYQVTGYTGRNPDTSLIANLGVEFAGLTPGPTQLEGGIYSNLLFGISADGEIHAFDILGNPQPVFVDGQPSVDTGLNSVTGLEFSTLDTNLWHTSTNRQGDQGHGIDIPVDNSRFESNGGQSFYFGFQNPGANGWGKVDPRNRNDYDFPGGAQGTLITNPFSLEGYSASDDPVLYFNYFLETEGTDYNPNTGPPTPMRDSFRVFIADDNGDWQLLATNDSFRSASQTDEFELGDGAIVSLVDEVAGRRGVQELYDNTGTWRQARIQLASWAGQEDLQLKFEFATAASVDLGGTGGVEIRGVPGADIIDGDIFTIDAGVNFEFDMGYVLVAQAASQCERWIAVHRGWRHVRV